MGLYVEFDVEEEYELYSQTLVYVMGFIPAIINMDWTPACEVFVKVFKEEAIRLVPVDTGYLRSTIDAGFDIKDGRYRCWAEASAEYAEYVEYGTWFMRAQPYFEPALEKAMQAFWKTVEDIQDKAKEDFAKVLVAYSERMLASITDFFLMVLFIGIIMYVVEIVNKLFKEIFGEQSRKGKLPEILIT